MTPLSQTENRILMSQARESLKGRWGLAIGTFVVYFVIIMAVNFIPVVGWIGSLLIDGPMALGFCIFTISLSRKQDVQLAKIFNGFSKFGVALGAFLLQAIFICLWALLLIVPGIIAALSYSMTFYIIAENDKIGPLEAITKSNEMMKGNKWKLFCLWWRFFGWALLCLLSLGIGFLWLAPYMGVSYANFYNDLNGNKNDMSLDLNIGKGIP